MDEGPNDAASRRIVSLAEKMKDEQYRHGYVASHTRQLLARQMRLFRGDASQTEYGQRVGMPQTIVSRLENPDYSGWSLNTLFKVSRKQNVAVFVRFVDFPTFLTYTGDLSEGALRPSEYHQEAVDALAHQNATATWRGAERDFQEGMRIGQELGGGSALSANQLPAQRSEIKGASDTNHTEVIQPVQANASLEWSKAA